MKDEVVRYHNKLNTISMRRWNAEEMNFFFTVIAKVRDKGTRLVTLNSDDLKELSGFANEHKRRWIDTMDSVSDKALDLRYFENTESKRIKMNLFTYFEIDEKRRTVEVEVSSKFEYIVNRLEAQFTQFELLEFTNIRSTYAKTMYRLIKQWRTVGKKEYKVDEFRELLEVPKSYTNGEVTRRVLEPIQKELANYFLNFKYKVIKSNKRGNPVLGYEFTWKSEITGVWEKDKYKKNDFYKPKKVESNVPNWVEKGYKHSATAEEQAKLEELKRSMFED